MPVSAYIIDFVISHQSELVHGRQGKKIKRRKGIRGKKHTIPVRVLTPQLMWCQKDAHILLSTHDDKAVRA